MNKTLPNDIINMIMKYVGPTPTSKLINTKYLTYEPEYINGIKFIDIKKTNCINKDVKAIYIFDNKTFFISNLFKYIEKRLADMGIHLLRITKFRAVGFASTNDAHIDFFFFKELRRQIDAGIITMA